VARAAALHLAGGVLPASCVALHKGRLAAVAPEGGDFRLQRASGAWLLAVDGRAFFNFAVRRWQPLAMAHGPYSPVRELLYVAFVAEASLRGPARGTPALFVKLGYRELAEEENDDQDALIGYVEKKTAKLKITNVAGAGIFVFKVPKSHQVFARPCRAAEASLKTELLNSSDVAVTPSGHCGELGAFSASLEYMFVEDAAEGSAGVGPLAALTKTLRSFTGDPTLSPYSARASDGTVYGGGSRKGRKRLRAWRGSLEVAPPPPAASAASSLPSSFAAAAVATGSPTAAGVGAMRSRAKRALLEGGARPAGPRLAFFRRSV